MKFMMAICTCTLSTFKHLNKVYCLHIRSRTQYLSNSVLLLLHYFYPKPASKMRMLKSVPVRVVNMPDCIWLSLLKGFPMPTAIFQCLKLLLLKTYNTASFYCVSIIVWGMLPLKVQRWLIEHKMLYLQTYEQQLAIVLLLVANKFHASLLFIIPPLHSLLF